MRRGVGSAESSAAAVLEPNGGGCGPVPPPGVSRGVTNPQLDHWARVVTASTDDLGVAVCLSAAAEKAEFRDDLAGQPLDLALGELPGAKS